jgi:hypothetical protein
MGFDHPHLSSAGPKSATLRVQFELVGATYHTSSRTPE